MVIKRGEKENARKNNRALLFKQQNRTMPPVSKKTQRESRVTDWEKDGERE